MKRHRRADVPLGEGDFDVDLVYLIMCASGSWHAPHELRSRFRTVTGRLISGSSVTARIRDMRQAPYGSRSVPKRRIAGVEYVEYRLEASDEERARARRRLDEIAGNGHHPLRWRHGDTENGGEGQMLLGTADEKGACRSP